MTLLNAKPKRMNKWQHRYYAEKRFRKTLFVKVFIASMIVGVVVSAILQMIAYGN